MQFNEITRRFYDLLKACHNGRDYEPDSKLEIAIEEALGDYERAEILQEPLPPWAVGLNICRSIQNGAQLFTRNGARTGNAHILRCTCTRRRYSMDFSWECLTESGNVLNLTIPEIHQMFTIGPYLCDPKEVEAKYGNRKEPNGSGRQIPEHGG